MKHLLRFAIGLSVLVSVPALAIGDADAGQAKSAVCAACHGVDGNSVVPNWPKLAGQHAEYLERQIGLIQSGARPVPEMAPIVANLSEQDIEDLAAYFSSQTTAPGLTDESLRAAGELIYMSGNPDTDIPACMSCHGPSGEGNPLSVYPHVAGQFAVYTEKMLTGFRAGTTWGPDDANSKIMTDVTKRMTDEEIKAVASYMQGLYRVAE